MIREPESGSEKGVALLAVLFALVLLMLLTLSFSVSMTVGADAAMRDVEETSVQQASASVRDMLITTAAMSHPALDPTPGYDGLDEWPGDVVLPKAFEGLTDDGKVLLGGSVVDLQRFLQLDSASPLLLANVIGTTTRLSVELKKDDRVIEVDDASNLPDAGWVWIAGELIQYGEKKGNQLGQLARGQLQPEFADGTVTIDRTALVLDYRCVLAAAWPTFGADATRQTRHPYRSVSELLAIEKAGFGSFTAAEMDALQRVFCIDTMAATAATWGRRERVFNELVAGQTNVITVKSAAHLGAGSTVRLINIKTGAVEYGLVMAVATDHGSPDVQFRPVFQLQLLFHVTQTFHADDTMVEPLIPAPVNVNTAPPEVLTALCAQVRPGADVRVHEDTGKTRLLPNWITPSQAREVTDELATQRAPGTVKGPFTGWHDFSDRVWKPRLEQLKGSADIAVWIALYRNLQTGRDSVVEMGTAPVCFQSGPWIEYRAAASRSSSAVAAGVAARHERSGVAAAMPGFTIERRWSTQEQYEDAFLLDRRSQFWTTFPINLGALLSGAPGLDPAPRWFANLAAVAYPNLGFGEQRFATTDEADSGFAPAPSTAVSSEWVPGRQELRGADTFQQTTDARGHDVKKLGPYLMQNTGPSTTGNQASKPPSPRHDRISFPFSNRDSFVERFGIQFWTEPQSLGNCILFEHGTGDPDRNQLRLEVKDGNLVWRVLDEAGRDPDPSKSPAGIKDAASEWSVPVADLALPANTPMHVAVSATSGRPADLSFAIDGITRGKPKYATYLTAALPVFDPTLGNNNGRPGTTNKSERFVDVQVESTKDFPAVGILRIGLELFEYSSMQGNSFRCQWKDSLGGRGARQVGREFRPSIPMKDGKPAIDINDPQFQGANLDFFPAHAAGSLVELYGGAAVLSEDTPMMPGKTTLAGSVGGFTVARAFIDNPRPITVQAGPFTIPLGTGLDETWVGDIKLADPLPTRNNPPQETTDEIANSFATGGGYALLVQRRQQWQSNQGGQLSLTTSIGGVELIKFAARQGSKLTGVQRAQTIPGDASQIDRQYNDNTPRKFVTDWSDNLTVPTQPPLLFDQIPTLILWVVPVSITVQSAKYLIDPQSDPAHLVQWVQLYPQSSANDTEWVRYDAILENRFLVRGNRAAWDHLRYTLTRQLAIESVQINQTGPSNVPRFDTKPPWGTVTETSGYIGYIPRIEAQYPQIQAARYALRFRGDPMQDFYGDGNQARSDPNAQSTSSHAQNNAMVTQCHRAQLAWGNYGAYSGRLGRNDRVAILSGSMATGSQRPAPEWQTVNWVARRYEADNIPQPGQGKPPELLGPWPFQLFAFQDEVRGMYLGPPRATQITESRHFDRIVKFPSGELPAAYCEQPSVGGGYGNQQPMTGFVDEVEVVQHFAKDLVVDEAFDAGSKELRANRAYYLNSTGAVWAGGDLSAAYPEHGGLLQVDDEILAYQSRAAGSDGSTDFASFTVATNGRGLLNTEARAHDRGARVKFLTHRPAAILSGGVAARDSVLPLQARGALPGNYGTVLLGRELLHYAWIRAKGDQVTLEMPRWYPPDRRDDTSMARGLFRGRFATTPQGASSGEPVIGFPFRYWDRHAEHSDDPEESYFQITLNEAPAFFRSITWRQETTDPRVEVLCMVRADGKLPWEGDPLPAGGYWQFRTPTQDGAPHKLAHQATRLEIRFATVYKPGCIDLATFQAHAWKTAPRIEDVRVEYEGEGRVFDERVTAR